MTEKINKRISIPAFWLLLVAMLCYPGCEFEQLHQNFDPNSGPVTPAFEVDSISNNGYNPSLVFFKNNSTGGDIYSWNFGDPASGGDNTSTDKNPSHLYENPGVYTVSLTVENAETNVENTVNMNVTIEETHTFSRTFSNVGSTFRRFWDALVLENGDYLIMGAQGDDNDTDPYFIKYDEEGNNRSGFPKVVELTGKGEARAGIETSNGNIAVTGYFNNGGFNDEKVALYQFDQDLNLMAGFPKTYGSTTRGTGYDIIETASGGYAIVGGIGGSGGADFFVTMLTASAQELNNFPRTYNEFDFTETANAILQLDNEEFIMIGSDVTLFRLFINRMDASGNDMNGSPFYIDGRDGNDFIVLPDGSLMIVGRNLQRMDLNGNDFPGFPKNLGNRFTGNDIILTREGDVVFVGQLDDDLVLYRTDLNGTPLAGFPKTFPASERSMAYSVTQASDGGFLIAGTIFTSDSRGYVIKTDANGLVED